MLYNNQQIERYVLLLDIFPLPYGILRVGYTAWILYSENGNTGKGGLNRIKKHNGKGRFL